jgi:hypothetical protein
VQQSRACWAWGEDLATYGGRGSEAGPAALGAGGGAHGHVEFFAGEVSGANGRPASDLGRCRGDHGSRGPCSLSHARTAVRRWLSLTIPLR